jgi:hypothetical protein
LVASDHASGHVVADIAMEEPDAGTVGDHIHGFHLGRSVNHICSLAVKIDDLAIPMWCVEVVGISGRQKILAHALAFFHREYRHVAEHVAMV